MENIKVFVMANIIITDADEYKNYEKGFFPILKNITAYFLLMMIIKGHKEGVKKLEGRAILFGFPSQQDADNWFEDPEYQTLSEHRKRELKHNS